jgi:hypothetical protein
MQKKKKMGGMSHDIPYPQVNFQLFFKKKYFLNLRKKKKK